MIGPLLLPERGRWTRPAGNNRLFLNGMLHVLRVGCPWRDMHERYGKWNSVYVGFRRWSGASCRSFPPRSNRKVPEHPNYRRYKDRNRVERMFGQLKQQRRIATRYDKTFLSFERFLNLAATRRWLKSFVNTA